MFEWFLSWEITSVLVALLFAAASTFLTLNDFSLAKLFFIVAAVDALAGEFAWSTKAEKPIWQMAIITFVLAGGTICLTFLTIKYVDQKKSGFDKLIAASDKKEGPSTIEFRNTAMRKLVDRDAVPAPDKELPGSTFVVHQPIMVKAKYANTSDFAAGDVLEMGILRLIKTGPDTDQSIEREWNRFIAQWKAIPNTLPRILESHRDAEFVLYTKPLTQEEVEELKDQKMLVFFFGAIRWKDAIGEYQTTLCSYNLPSMKQDDPLKITWMDVPRYSKIREPFEKWPE